MDVEGRRSGAAIFLVALGSAVVASVGVLHPVHLEDPAARGAIETLTASGALLTAALLLGQFGHSHRRRDLLLLFALATISVTDLGFSAVPAWSGSDAIAPGLAPRLGAELLVSIAFAAAALAPNATIVGPRRRELALTIVGGLGIALLVVLLSSIGSRHFAMVTVAIACSGLLLLAGITFGLRARHGERESAVLAAASFLLAAAKLQYPAGAIAADWVTPRDGLRLAAYSLLLAAALRERAAWRRRDTEEAVSAERERIARDLHDGLAQDLAFIAAHGERLATELGVEHPVAIAARRALAASRGAIVDLAASAAPTTAAALCSVAHEVASRFGVAVEVLAEDDAPSRKPGGATRVLRANVGQVDRDEVVRIAREAMVNAVRHGGASHITVQLGARGDDVLLRVSDDGCGIRTGSAPSASGSGFGLPAMRARAEALGAQLIARSPASGGTEIDVVAARRLAS